MKEFATLILALIASTAAHAAEFAPAAEGEKTPFPTAAWSEYGADDPMRARMDAIIARAFEGKRPPALARMRALVVVVHGRIAGERYAEGITKDTRLQSWSMAKSVLHAALGLAVADGKLEPDMPAPVPEWRGEDDPRHAITLRHLMTMTDGLAFREDYGDTNAEVMQMLFGAGRGDVGAAAAASPLAHKPGTKWSYSGGSGNILSRVLRDALGGRESYERFLKERLFRPLGMTSALAEFDAAGTWIASSYVHATARDYARFGLLYLSRGFWDGRQFLPRDWVKAACEATAASKGRYGALFWLNARDPQSGRAAVSELLPTNVCFARGFGGQLIAIVPSHDTVIVMLNGAYTDDTSPIVGLIGDILNAAKGGPAP